MLAELRGLQEECGVFGIWNHPRAAQMTYYALHSLQHRGQEGLESQPRTESPCSFAKARAWWRSL